MCPFCGDFDLVREAKDNFLGVVNNSWTYLFNDWINKWALMETKLANRVYTSSNNQNHPILLLLIDFSCSQIEIVIFPSPPFVLYIGLVVIMLPSFWTLMRVINPLIGHLRLRTWWVGHHEFAL